MKTILRYPGGKSRLSKILIERFKQGKTFYDPFVGGGSVLLAYAKKYPQSKLRASDLNPCVSSFWNVIATRPNDLCDSLKHLDVPFFKENLNYNGNDEVLLARKLLAVNKGSFNGYIFEGAIPVGGWDQKGKWKVDWCWKTEKLRLKILELSKFLENRLEVQNCSVFESNWFDSDVFYFDPPYVKEGGKMYAKFGKFDHVAFAEKVKPLNNWVLSYDEHELILDLYKDCKIERISSISSRKLNSGKLKKQEELIISG